MNFNVYIGYDEREDIAAEVCAYSIKKRVLFNEPDIWFLKSQNLDTYTRPREPNQSTQQAFWQENLIQASQDSQNPSIKHLTYNLKTL